MPTMTSSNIRSRSPRERRDSRDRQVRHYDEERRPRTREASDSEHERYKAKRRVERDSGSRGANPDSGRRSNDRTRDQDRHSRKQRPQSPWSPERERVSKTSRGFDNESQQVARSRASRSKSPRGDRHGGRRREERRSDHRRDRSPRSSRRSSPTAKRRRRSYSASKSPPAQRARGPLPSQMESFGAIADPTGTLERPVEKQKPNFAATGLLAKEANTVAGTKTILKYHEPPEARKAPGNEQWRMYIFKGKDMLDTVHLYQRSCWLMGRDQAIADLALEHPSISKQHAVIQFRYMPKKNEYGDRLDSVKPYLIDLESANGTRMNGKAVEASRFVELRDGDVLGFGESEREYVLMLPPAES